MKVFDAMLSLFVLGVASIKVASSSICCEEIKSDVEGKELAYSKLCSTVTSDLEKCCEDLEKYVEKQHKAYETLCPEINQFHANFTNLEASGRHGPTSLGSHYVGKDHENMVTVENGTQFWTVPYTGTYEITAVGAAGGYDKTGSSARGRGAYMRGNFDFNKGDVIKILIGQEGGPNTAALSSLSAGGGGGSFVATSSNTPLIVAGGGGGIQALNTILANCDASTGTSGRQNECKHECSIFPGGVNGSGALDAGDSSESGGGGGGGFYSNGHNGKNLDGRYEYGAEGGRGFIQGGEGGWAVYNKAVGGFGGGGGSYGARGGAGGGGGYSGGASGDTEDGSCGGGGGSYNIGKKQVNKEGLWANGHGYVEIRRLA